MQHAEFEKNITFVATPFVQCLDVQNKSLKSSIAVLQVTFIAKILL